MRMNDALVVWPSVVALMGAALMATPAAGDASMPGAAVAATSAGGSSVRIPTKPDASLFQGESGRPSTEIHYDPSTREVTVRLVVQDRQGTFIPNIRRDNFVVYENGLRQENAAVEVEHPPLSVGLLLESGGHYPSLDEALAEAAQNAAGQLLNELGSDDKIAIWRYGDTLEPVADFSESRETVRRALRTLPTPRFSELNYYDALLASLNSLQSMQGRKALIVVTSGIDTFSRANFEDVLRAARESGVTIYAIDLSPVAHRQGSLASIPSPYAKLNWKRADAQLLELTRAAGGRTYAPDSMLDLSAIYDDLMENLRVRYVLTYKSSADPTSERPRTVRIALVDAKTGGPLKIRDEDQHPILAKMIVEDRYTPRADSLARLHTSGTSSP
jgi:VWFA-related protein